MENFEYSFEKLNDDISVCVTPDHKFGTDAFLLADFANPRHKDKVCDLGTGCGIIPLYWCKRHIPAHIFAVDIQEKAIAQLKISLEKCGLSDKITPIHKDLKELCEIEKGSLDIVSCNPPYFADSAGIISESKAEKIARHETLCTIYDVCKTASSLLKFGGKLCICQRPERLCDVLEAMRQNKIEPKLLRFVQQRADTAPWLFLIEGKKGGKPFLQVSKPLIIEGENGFSDEVLKSYGKI